MTCVVDGTLVETLTGDGVMLRRVEDIRIGDVLNGVFPSAVVDVVVQPTNGEWPVYSYMGLDADAAQWILLPSLSWCRMSDVGTPSLRACKRLYGIVARNCNTVRAGGTTCRVMLA